MQIRIYLIKYEIIQAFIFSYIKRYLNSKIKKRSLHNDNNLFLLGPIRVSVTLLNTMCA